MGGCLIWGKFGNENHVIVNGKRGKAHARGTWQPVHVGAPVIAGSSTLSFLKPSATLTATSALSPFHLFALHTTTARAYIPPSTWTLPFRT
ncbi:hypothetical protein COLO4_18551 [Corchorus olitorius]|uniref:Uncharacterized protein n=1 Tax=Corchorus olitorius TaxID=93759 RepID=A0A1R3J8N8_9ROSI|nr:hypothetical protein COLO4_18551 [Corchorus olitorius]